MFDSLKLVSQEDIGERKVRAVFSIKDSCFTDDIELILLPGTSVVGEPLAMLRVYEQRHLNVARNLAIYYMMIDGAKYLNEDRDLIVKRFPLLNYDKRFPSVKRYLDEFKSVQQRMEEDEEFCARMLALEEKLKLKINGRGI